MRNEFAQKEENLNLLSAQLGLKNPVVKVKDATEEVRKIQEKNRNKNLPDKSFSQLT